MSKEKGSSKGTSEKKKQCIKEVKVTNQFKKMMSEALEATRKVLDQRQNDLSEKGWSNEKQEEFYQIFGVKDSAVITIDSEEEKKKAKAADPINPMDPYIEKQNITAYIFMQESVDRLINICDRISVESDTENNDSILHGNFLNTTNLNKGSASVPANQTLGLNIDRYNKILRINIYQNFIGKPLMGFESQTSTLCHELSHFYRSGDNGIFGGMGTIDMSKKGRERLYYEYANELIDTSSQYVFKNSYNIEKYFELVL